ncbi:hypothetical protein [Jannaschia marina]|uniref:hypothetical protein n=1 Tax=Jannaschia marina TaxID=2741674 RepID=UPI0015CA9692|nr:hypothetical protein [Jannaschia marina]
MIRRALLCLALAAPALADPQSDVDWTLPPLDPEAATICFGTLLFREPAPEVRAACEAALWPCEAQFDLPQEAPPEIAAPEAHDLQHCYAANARRFTDGFHAMTAAWLPTAPEAEVLDFIEDVARRAAREVETCGRRHGDDDLAYWRCRQRTPMLPLMPPGWEPPR